MKALLDLIASGEANRGSPFGEYGGMHAGIKDAPNVADMTIGQVKQLQRDKVSQGAKSSAAGRYQIINKSMDKYKQAAGLTDDDVFSPDNQDRMITAYFQKNAGNDPEKIADVAAIEFAAIKNKNGVGNYDGKLNKATIDREKVLNAAKKPQNTVTFEDVDYDPFAQKSDIQYEDVDYDPFAVAEKPSIKPVGRINKLVKGAIDPSGGRFATREQRDVANIGLKNAAGGLYRGAVDVGGGIAMPFEYAYDKLTGNQSTHDARVKRIDDKFNKNYDTNSNQFKGGRVGSQIALTLPVGGVLGAGAKAVGATKLGNSLASGGFTLGAAKGAPAVKALSTQGAINAATRIAGGAGAGAAADALINNGGDGTGAVIGGALPIAVKAPGTAGKIASYPLKYLTDKGQNSLIANKLSESIGGNLSDVIRKLNLTRGATKGFNPTVGQSGVSNELAAIERALQQRSPELFKDTINQQGKAILNAANSLGADEATISAFESARKAGVKPFYDVSENTEVIADDVFDTLMARPKIKDAYAAAEQNALNRGESMTNGKYTDDVLYQDGAPSESLEFSSEATKDGKKISGGKQPLLLAQVRKLGGINIKEISDVAGEKSTRQGKLPVGLFTKKGQFSDDLADQLNDLGYIPPEEMARDGGAGYLREALTDSIRGNKQYALNDLPFRTPDINYTKTTNFSVPNKSTNFEELNPRNIYKGKNLQEIKFALDEFKKFNPMASSGENATRRGAVDASNAFNDYLRKNIPSMAAADETFAKMSKPIDQANLGNQIIEKFVPAKFRNIDNPNFSNGELNTSFNIDSFAKILNNRDTGNNLAKHVTGYSGATLDNTLSSKQVKTMNDIFNDLNFITYGKNAGSNGGSQTAQLQFMNAKSQAGGLVSEMMNKGGIVTRGIKAVADFTKLPIEQKTAFILQNPKEAAKLLSNELSKQEKTKALVNLIENNAKLLPSVAVSGQSR